MKFKTEKRQRTVSHTVDGTTNNVTEPYDVRVPVLPADWDQRAIKAAVGVVIGLTTVAVVWSTVSIGALLDGGIGYAAAAVFDAAWIVNVLLEYLARFDPKKRAFSKRLGWALLAATMGAIFWHGLLAGSLALGVVGAGVSLFAKVLWMGVMRFINRDLSDRDQQWVEAEISKSNAQLAIAGVRRQVARAESRAALELLAVEQTRAEVTEWLGTGQQAGPAVASPAGTRETSAVSAREDGTAEIASADRPAPENPLFQAPDVRPDVRPESASTQVSTPDNVRTIRPDIRPEPEPTPPVPAPTADQEEEDERFSEEKPRRVSIAKEVRRMVADGMTDADYIVRSLSGRFDRTDDRFASTVKRYVREAKQTDNPVGQGLYL